MACASAAGADDEPVVCFCAGPAGRLTGGGDVAPDDRGLPGPVEGVELGAAAGGTDKSPPGALPVWYRSCRRRTIYIAENNGEAIFSSADDHDF